MLISGPATGSPTVGPNASYRKFRSTHVPYVAFAPPHLSPPASLGAWRLRERYWAFICLISLLSSLIIFSRRFPPRNSSSSIPLYCFLLKLTHPLRLGLCPSALTPWQHSLIWREIPRIIQLSLYIFITAYRLS